MHVPKSLATALTAAVLATLALSGIAAASHPQNYTLFGDAEIVSPGNASDRAVRIRSECPTGYPTCLGDGSFTFGGIAFGVPSGLTFGQLDQLSTDFKPEGVDDLCLGGAPRFQIGIDTDGDGDRDGTIWAYFGPESLSLPCLPGVWQNTTDMLEAGHTLDTTQLPGGAYQDPYLTALAKYGAMRVTSISVVVDSSWIHPDGEQTFFIDNTNVDGAVYTYERGHPQATDDCKDGGWMELVRDDGTTFKNQGDCIQYVNTGK